MAIYRVTGSRAYREHPPGTTFEADLEPAAEARAIGRGDIVLVRAGRVKVDEQRVRRPRRRKKRTE